MRLGVIGPCLDEVVALANAAHVLLDQTKVERVLYLGKDDALDRVVASWAHDIVGSNPSESVVFERAARSCVNASPEEIELFVASERARRRLRILTTVPAPPGRTIELFDGRIAVFVYDKALLDEDDIAGASVLVFGKSDKALAHHVGSRTFVTPGRLAPETRCGVAVIDDEGGNGIQIDFLDKETGVVLSSERIEGRVRAQGKLKVQGPSGS